MVVWFCKNNRLGALCSLLFLGDELGSLQAVQVQLIFTGCCSLGIGFIVEHLALAVVMKAL